MVRHHLGGLVEATSCGTAALGRDECDALCRLGELLDGRDVPPLLPPNAPTVFTDVADQSFVTLVPVAPPISAAPRRAPWWRWFARLAAQPERPPAAVPLAGSFS
jgi:hypothetical protein